MSNKITLRYKGANVDIKKTFDEGVTWGKLLDAFVSMLEEEGYSFFFDMHEEIRSIVAKHRQVALSRITDPEQRKLIEELLTRVDLLEADEDVQ